MYEQNDKFIIFFGNSQSCNVDYKSFAFEGFCQDFAHKHNLDKMLFNKQVHGANGFLVNSVKLVQDFKNIETEGDFLITDQEHVGIGILTADCLPIFFYDPKNHVAASIHAGWKSSVLDICKATFNEMNKKYGTVAQDLLIYFGPSAKPCCYQVQPNFMLNLKKFSFQNQVIQVRGQDLFFDNVLFNKLLMQNFGVDPQKINCDYNFCTICNRSFHSYRRDSHTRSRQISFIALV
ncbi:MAG: hypothetical protein US49_C0006G0027 [candidate division TM6 bacterium GW2011_GWF2_37_49]|nr:MAG: hypothetical protein US49_C0006G0027 [candidate division TM6 bacterium GW2011_GWF2_37_49]